MWPSAQRERERERERETGVVEIRNFKHHGFGQSFDGAVCFAAEEFALHVGRALHKG